MDEKETRELFVPGRLCLFGEHSDWAGGHRRQNSDIEKGYVIVAPTNQGNYARTWKLKTPDFQFTSKTLEKSLTTNMTSEALLKVAEEGKELSYVAGVAHEIISSYNFLGGGGLHIENYNTDLPIKKGLSSSASICVLTARAFNEVYGLNFTPRRIMELAYLGEITTPSRWGKMDQACAFDQPILMTFDGDRVEIDKLEVGRDLYFLIVDLKKGKDTKKILGDLNKGFPWPENPFEEAKQRYFKVNKEIVMQAKEVLKRGDALSVGSLMNYAQERFDSYLMPASPVELEAPVLHSVISMPDIQKFIYGGKGIGSGGDGSAQIICKSKEDREEVKKLLTTKKFECLNLDLKETV
jgi:mevalonate kinase